MLKEKAHTTQACPKPGACLHPTEQVKWPITTTGRPGQRAVWGESVRGASSPLCYIDGSYTCNIQIVGLPWYEEASYQAVTALMQDPDRLFTTYAAWHLAAQRTEDQVRRNGQTAIRVPLDLVQFPAWCAARRLRIDAQARMDYAAFIAAQQHRAGQEGARH